MGLVCSSNRDLPLNVGHSVGFVGWSMDFLYVATLACTWFRNSQTLVFH